MHVRVPAACEASLLFLSRINVYWVRAMCMATGCSAVKVGRTNFSAAEVTENILAAMPTIIEHIKKGWKSVQAIHLKVGSEQCAGLFGMGGSDVVCLVVPSLVPWRVRQPHPSRFPSSTPFQSCTVPTQNTCHVCHGSVPRLTTGRVPVPVPVPARVVMGRTVMTVPSSATRWMRP